MWQTISLKGRQRSKLLGRSRDQFNRREEKKELDSLLIGNKGYSNTKMFKKTHSLDVQMLQLLIERLPSWSSLVLQLVPNVVDTSVSSPGRVQVGR